MQGSKRSYVKAICVARSKLLGFYIILLYNNTRVVLQTKFNDITGHQNVVAST